jgi:uncharacterized protein (TIRG00374 family)
LLFWILRFVGFSEIKQSLSLFGLKHFFIIIAITFVMAIFGIWKWKEILRGEGIKISFFSIAWPYLGGYALMYLIPVLIWGGEIFRAYILKERDSVPLEKGMASIIIDRILEWTINMLVIIVGIGFFFSNINLLPKKIEIFFGGVFLLFAIALIFFYSKVFKKESIIKTFVRFLGLKRIQEKNSLFEGEKDIYKFFRFENRTMWNAIILAFLRAGATWARVILVIFFLGQAAGLSSSLSILGFNNLASMVPIPASLGSNEAIQTFAFNSLGFSQVSAAAFAMLIRGAELSISIIGILVLFRYGIFFIRKILFKEIEDLTKEA